MLNNDDNLLDGKESAQRALHRFEGLSCHDFKWFEFNTLILFIDSPDSLPDEEVAKVRWRLWCDCDWRLRDDCEIIAYNRDDDALVSQKLAGIKGEKITRVSLRDFNIEIDFEGGLKLEVVVRPGLEQQWEIRGSDGYRLRIENESDVIEQFVG